MQDNTRKPESISAAALAGRENLSDYSHTFPCHMHFNGPGDSGFGVKKVTMLLPECAMLMVSPCGCGRSGTVVGQKGGFEERVFYYQMDDRDTVTGRYLDRLTEAGRLILRKMHPRAILICMTCVDSLMGTDLDGLCRKLTRELGIPVTGSFMDPMVRESRRAPIVKVQQAVMSCLEKTEHTDSYYNLLGNFAVLNENSELYELIKYAGGAGIRTLAACKSYDDFLEMADSAGNIVVHFQGEAAAKDLQKRLGTPYVLLEQTYCPERTAQAYEKLSEFLKTPLPYQPYLTAAKQSLSRFSASHKGLRVGVGEAVLGSSLELAATLLEGGVSVEYVFRNLLYPGDREALRRLAAIQPDLPIYSGVHPSTRKFPGGLPAVDLTVGLDAGYFAADAVSVGWGGSEFHYGFEALTGLLARMENSLAHPKTQREQMTGSYLTV